MEGLFSWAVNSPFIGDLVIRVVPHWEIPASCHTPLFELMQCFGFVSKTFGRIKVPKGFVTDFGSVPTFAKPIVDNDDPDLVYASIVHDWLYKNAGKIEGAILPVMILSRRQCDDVLYEAMIASGAPKAKAWYVYRAVRLGGGSAFRVHAIQKDHKG